MMEVETKWVSNYSSMPSIGYYYNTSSSPYSGIHILLSYFTTGKTYRIEFSAKKESGDMNWIGGHNQNWSDKLVFLDNRKIGTNWNGVLWDQNVNDGEWHRYVIYTKLIGGSDENGFWIQPNRGASVERSVIITGIYISEVDETTLNNKTPGIDKAGIFNAGAFCEGESINVSNHKNGDIWTNNLIEF